MVLCPVRGTGEYFEEKNLIHFQWRDVFLLQTFNTSFDNVSDLFILHWVIGSISRECKQEVGRNTFFGSDRSLRCHNVGLFAQQFYIKIHTVLACTIVCGFLAPTGAQGEAMLSVRVCVTFLK